jgi:hypothetical protein
MDQILLGDVDGIQRQLHQLQRRIHQRSGKRKLRKEKDVCLRGNQKKECDKFVDCTAKMSLYDLFVYLYYDDFTDDENVFYHDDKDALAKFDPVKRLVSEARDSKFCADKCDSLLSQFHRFVEKCRTIWYLQRSNSDTFAELSRTSKRLQTLAPTLSGSLIAMTKPSMCDDGTYRLSRVHNI